MLTKEEMQVLFRDMMTAMDVGQKAEMGYYDVSFVTCGCTHYAQGERHYHVSSNAAKIYDFIERAALDDLHPTALITRTFKKPIPRGLKEILELDLKKDLAQTMQSVFSVDFFRDLGQLAQSLAQNAAADLLNAYMDTLVCTFDRDRFDLLAGTLILAVSQKKLSLKDYQLLLHRLNDERQSITDELKPHDLFHQTFHACAYLDADGRRQYICDARKDYVYAQRYALESAGAAISPLFTKTCFYNYDYRLTDARRDFVHSLPALFDDAYGRLLAGMRALPARMSPADFTAVTADFRQCYGPAASETLAMYGHRWQI